MSFVLLLSILLRIFATLWSLFVLNRVREWCLGFLTLMLAVMTARQIFEFVETGLYWSLTFDVTLDSLAALGVSFMSVFVIYLLDYMLRHIQKTETGLREAGLRYRLASKAGNVGFLDWDLTTDEVYLDDGMVEMLDIKDHKRFLNQADLEQIVHSDDREKFLTTVREFMAGSRADFELLHRLVNKNGQSRWILARGTLVRNEEDIPKRILLSNTDVTALKHAQQSLRGSLDRLEYLYTETPLLVQSVDIDGAVLQANDNWLRAVGYERTEVIGKPALDFLSQKSRTRFKREVMANFRKTGKMTPTPLEYQTKNGQLLDVLCSAAAQKDSEGNDIGTLVTMFDISPLKKAERENSFFAYALRSISDFVVIADIDKRIRYANKTYLTSRGYTEREIIGKSFEALPVPDESRAAKAGILNALASGGWRGELLALKKDGTKFPVQVSASPVLDDENNILGFIAIGSDLTEKKAAEQELRKAYAEVEQLKDRLEAENVYLQEEIRKDHDFDEIVGSSKEILEVLRKVESVAHTETSVLITGETGTGKELIARAVHSLSNQHAKPLVKVNCTAISPMLVESELFGHEKGAFTGAIRQRMGRFELADGGSIFLDEIGDLPIEIQAKLLRVLQEQTFERVGGSESISVSVRVISATNRNLEQNIQKGTFRSDLFYRLNVFPIALPPLRKRRSDIPVLANHFLEQYARRIGKTFDGISRASMTWMMEYDWPGNVRELANVIERAAVTASGATLDIQPENRYQASDESRLSCIKTMEEAEREHIINILNKTDWQIGGPGGAAELLGLHKNTLRSRMQKLGIKKT